MFQKNGFDINKATAHGLLAKTTGLFKKLYEALRQAVKEGMYVYQLRRDLLRCTPWPIEEWRTRKQEGIYLGDRIRP